VEARHQIYAPLYAKAVETTIAYLVVFVLHIIFYVFFLSFYYFFSCFLTQKKRYGKLKKMYESNKGHLELWDFDGYDHKSYGLTLERVFYNRHEKMVLSSFSPCTSHPH
jgi:hypothetical protein